MQRSSLLDRISSSHDPWDVAIVGGGATGLGVAIESAARGYRTVLFEQHDFAKGTSSRSTKLVHGGVRYLQQGNVNLVVEALKERGRLLRNAPHLVRNLPFIVPNYDWWEGPFYGVGLKVYDLLAGKEGFGRSKILTRDQTMARIPTIEPEGLRGGVIYYDGQFDDARLAINMAQTAYDLGATVLNYVRVTRLVKENDMVAGVEVTDEETGQSYTCPARVVINATGVFTDTIRRMDDPDAQPMIQASQGVHLVLDKRFLPGDSAIMVPQTDDGRVLFVIPWHDRAVVGTTDTPVPEASLEPRALDEELEFLLTHAKRYLADDPAESDVLSVFAGLRPLVKTSDDANTAAISRDHTIHISTTGLLTITGGKWTTYRKMAEDTVDQAATLASLDERLSMTRDLHLHGWHVDAQQFGALSMYGSDAPGVQSIMAEQPANAERLHPNLPYVMAEVRWAVRHEMARTLDDVLSRRTRALLLDARASREIAPAVVRVMAEELGRDATWIDAQLADYNALVRGYLPFE